MTPQEQLDQAVLAWKPRFHIETSLAACADRINRPHEDYPHRVPITAALIDQLVQAGYHSVTANDCLQVHKLLMPDKPYLGGAWRNVTVTLSGSNYVPPAPMLVPDLIQQCFPFSPTSEQELIAFYTRFQCIHPFTDGNGRMGGILIAALSKGLFGHYLTPGQ